MKFTIFSSSLIEYDLLCLFVFLMILLTSSAITMGLFLLAKFLTQFIFSLFLLLHVGKEKKKDELYKKLS